MNNIYCFHRAKTQIMVSLFTKYCSFADCPLLFTRSSSMYIGHMFKKIWSLPGVFFCPRSNVISQTEASTYKSVVSYNIQNTTNSLTIKYHLQKYIYLYAMFFCVWHSVIS